ncbi:hypothetical protein [Paenibacillus sp. GCM10028914]|uniref:hypothetical protein n=1 Tax=Paenibacillus sp. GCM10028914 TaxID=3273416 RepID=UPI003609894A
MKQVIVFLLLIIVTGCGEHEDPVILKTMTLSEAYPGNITEIDKIELLDGSSGEKKIIEDHEVIAEWIRKIKDIELMPDDNQEGSVGYIFGISLYENNEIKLGFIPNQINEVYYKTNDEFTRIIKEFFEEQFEREF